MKKIRIAVALGLCFLALPAFAQEGHDAGVASEETPTRLGPVSIEGRHGRLEVGFGVQLRGTLTHDIEAEEDATDAVFHLRRGRLFLRGLFLEERVRFRLQIDFAPRALELIDLYFEGEITEAAVLRAGIAKIPFSDHWNQSFLRLAFVDWPLTERYFGGGRQLGFTLYDGRRDSRLAYAVGLYSGESTRAANGARFATVYGQRPINRSDLRNFTPMGTAHPELVGRLTYRGDALRLALSAAWDLRPNYSTEETLRLGLDGFYERGPLRFWAGIFGAASENIDGTLLGALMGTLVEAAYNVHPRVGLALRHSAIVRSNALRRDARRFADAAIDAAAGEEREALRRRYANIDRIAAQHETVFAVEVRIVGQDLKWTTDFGWLHTAGLGANEFRGRTQLQLGF